MSDRNRSAVLHAGVDGGGTHCRVRIRSADGALVGDGQAGTANLLAGLDTVAANIITATRAALRQGGRGEDDIGAIVAGLGLAGANVPELAAGLPPRLPFAGAILVQDTITACLGAFAGGDGAVAILGTGTAYVAKSGRAFHHVGGWGFTLGDEGSAARLGRSALVHALKAHDGTEPRGVLADLALARFGTPARIVAFAATAPPRDFGALAPLLFAAIEAGDPAAKAILAGAIIEIEAALDAILAMGSNRLCLMGGLADRYAVLLAERFGSRLVAPAADAMEGALLIARDASLVGGPGG